MTQRCQKCSGSIIVEPFSDALGSGQRLMCLSCGNDAEYYANLNHGGYTADQIREMAGPVPPGRRGGRPRKVAG